MTIPPDKQKEFEKWFKNIAGPIFTGFGAVKHELFKVADKPVIGKQTLDVDRYIERVYFNNDFDIPGYFTNVKNDSEAWKISRSYEGEFGASDIELRVLIEAG